MGLSSGATPRLTCDRCGRPTWRLVRDADALRRARSETRALGLG